MAKFQERVFSGVQPTGNLHLGNYLGAITKFVALQETHDCIYCVVDLHAITVPQSPANLKANIREVTAAFIAAGVDPRRHIVFNQSQVAEHAELAWVTLADIPSYDLAPADWPVVAALEAWLRA